MSGDRLLSTDPRLLQSETTAQWWRENVLNAMLNGSGVVQVYNNFVEKPVALPEVPQAETFTRDWAVHTLAEVGGAILPYLAAGKMVGCGLKATATKFEFTGFTNKVFANEGVSMVLGAGMYDFSKAPRQGETRLGNSLGSMATFSIFESGNALLKYSTKSMQAGFTKACLVGSSRGLVGATGGLAGFETSHLITDLQGVQNNTTRKQAWDAMASGGFLNIALPLAHKGLTKLTSGLTAPQFTGETILKGEPVSTLAPEGPSRGKVARFILEPETSSKHELAMWGGDAQVPGDHSLQLHSDRAGTEPGGTTAAGIPVLESGTGKPVGEPQPVAGDSVAARGEPLPKTEAKARSPEEAVKEKLPAVDIKGTPDQLGATVTEQGVNFAVHSDGATKVELLLFSEPAATKPSQVLTLFQTGSVWHRFVPELKSGALYLYRAHGPYEPAVNGNRFNGNKVVLDPYSKAVTADTAGDRLGYDNSNPADPERHLRPSSTDNVAEMPKSIVIKLGEFDWQGDKAPATPMTDTVIYEVGVRGFTATDPAVTHKGTYRGLVEKIPYLKSLGVTAVELLPIMKFDKADWPHIDPETGKPLGNAWGYNTAAFQAPEGRFAADGTHGQQIAEFKHMVRELHKANIEVILDIVFNHTRESDQYGPTVSFRGLDNKTYYLLKPGNPAEYVNHTGCGNTMNCNHPVVQKLILDTLRYWKTEMHVDGFRFDLASIFNYDINGVEQKSTPIIEAIQTDPVLKDIKLIAEAWSPANYRLGRFSETRWSEWNGDFRDVARKFIKGDPGQTATLADRIAGSPGWFDPKKGRYSINFITAHDGFTMRDLVSFNEKHNHRNGEHNNDGSNDNFSWNCGHEGPVKDAPLSDQQKAAIEQLRTQQQKNLFTLLFMSQGTPMLLYGDEVRRTQHGNNNSWPVEQLNNMDWVAALQNADMLRFTSMLIELRNREQIGRRGPEAIIWHGTEPFRVDFSEGARFIAWEYKPAVMTASTVPLYTAFNAYWQPLKIALPSGTKWGRLIDTGLPSGQDIVAPGTGVSLGTEYVIQPRTSIVLEGKPK